jgi:ATP-dependent helicase/DNAse subunit B
LSPVRGSNRARLLARCGEYFKHNQADRLLYLAASYSLLDLITQKLLDGNNAPGLWGEFPVYLFRGFVRRVLSEAESVSGSGAQSIPIDREDLPLRKSLISQIIKQLSASGRLRAIRPLANRDGCVNTIATLIGELQRAGKTPEEFAQAIDERGLDDVNAQTQNSKLKTQNSIDPTPRSQIDFDREVALIYQKYAEALSRHRLTDEDADQLQALRVMRGDIDGSTGTATWLDKVELLVLDGFFDFTPVQGEILKYLIPRIPNVIVNVNHDEQNVEIFRPFDSTIEHLQSIADFEIRRSDDESTTDLRRTLFNVSQVV